MMTDTGRISPNRDTPLEPDPVHGKCPKVGNMKPPRFHE
jgi:hypothetical protein